ncbi:MAG: S-methyl-5-thioribose-1-phosphate isomerase [Candidatus Omnitrophica bacterium]|nr:S-methyl-5-thioribose-1-phosphate isomerase [Candidatus Omnitrophota bacterium]
MRGAIYFKNNRLFYLDQTKLPAKEIYRECRNLKDGFKAIRYLQIRGAPLIGVFSAYCVYIAVKDLPDYHKDKFLKYLDKVVDFLKSARPTAVNLSWAVERIRNKVKGELTSSVKVLKKIILEEAKRIHNEDIKLCLRMAEEGVKLINSGDRILTHCNTGFLATSGEGTALGVIYKAEEVYKNIKVFVDETRPLLQGARLTAWELCKRKVSATLITDNMGGYLMKQGMIDKVFVGADRITLQGDVANKIGTYSVAVLANYHKIPFYVVAPFSSFDLTLDKGEDIPIEERSPWEVKCIDRKLIAPKSINVYNPAFDVTPHHLITAIVTDRGIIYPPFKKNIKMIISYE